MWEDEESIVLVIMMAILKKDRWLWNWTYVTERLLFFIDVGALVHRRNNDEFPISLRCADVLVSTNTRMT